MATAATTTAARPETTKRHRFPRRLGRFINLEGGLYGQLDLVAITATLLELQTGEDFVQVRPAPGKNLRDTIDKFLAFEHHEHHQPPRGARGGARRGRSRDDRRSPRGLHACEARAAWPRRSRARASAERVKALGEFWPWLGITAAFAVIAGAEAAARRRRKPDVSHCGGRSRIRYPRP